MQEQAIRDPLTSCFNQRYLAVTPEREFARAKREAYPLSLVVLDIDHFKILNDSYGQQAGDAVLGAMGILLSHHLRAGDIAYRYGGEEFFLLMPNMKREDAIHRSEFVAKLADAHFEHWFARLEQSIRLVIREPRQHLRGLTLLQHALVDLIDFLDPDGVRIPKDTPLKAEFKEKRTGPD